MQSSFLLLKLKTNNNMICSQIKFKRLNCSYRIWNWNKKSKVKKIFYKLKMNRIQREIWRKYISTFSEMVQLKLLLDLKKGQRWSWMLILFIKSLKCQEKRNSWEKEKDLGNHSFTLSTEKTAQMIRSKTKKIQKTKIRWLTLLL